MEFTILDPLNGFGFLISEDQEVPWAIASARIYKCGNCDAWHINTEEEALNIRIYN